MKNTQEAITIRNHILMTFEKMIIERKASDDGNWNLVIVGSGPTGVELAGAFSEMKTYIMPRDYPRMNFSDLNIILISSGDKPLEAMSRNLRTLRKNTDSAGVKFLKNERVTDYDGDKIYMQSGNSIPTNNVIWAAGVTGNIIDDFNKEKSCEKPIYR
jgi:NADH dehydrogenase